MGWVAKRCNPTNAVAPYQTSFCLNKHIWLSGMGVFRLLHDARQLQTIGTFAVLVKNIL